MTEALEFPAWAGQMRHLVELMESLPFCGPPRPVRAHLSPGPAPSASSANTAADGSHLLVHTPAGQGFGGHQRAGRTPRAYWFDPPSGTFDEVDVAQDYTPRPATRTGPARGGRVVISRTDAVEVETEERPCRP
ncbi:hypothetical protein HBB16_04250 [Pseudonocardia sp. MCCB 268]|nr:hypothetical protein [Pseudonocardia cytotoxica]